MKQTITVDCLGNTANTAGGSVVVREPYTGLYGLFYIDSDVHEWKRGQYYNKLTLNYKRMMDEQEREPAKCGRGIDRAILQLYEETGGNMMEENPYAGILEVVRTDADARSASPWVIGTVAATAPLTVMLGSIPLSGADLLVNPQLLPHEETAALSELKGSLEGSPAVSVTNGSLRGEVAARRRAGPRRPGGDAGERGRAAICCDL